MSLSPFSARALAAGVFALVVGVTLLGNVLAPPFVLAAESPPPVAATATYIGREACAACHATQDKDWASSHQAKAMQHAAPTTVQGDFNDAHFTIGDVTTTFSRQGDKFMVRTDGPEARRTITK